MKEERCGAVSDAFGVQAMQQAEIVGVFADFGEQVRDHTAALAAGAETPERFHEPLFGDFAEVAEPHAGEINVLAIPSDQFRLVVEGVDVTGATLHENEDDAFGAGGQGRPRSTRV